MRQRQRRRRIQSRHRRCLSVSDVLDTLSKKLLVMAGEASDAVSACAQVKMTEAPRLLGTKNANKPLQRLVKQINQTTNYWQFCHVGNQIGDCKPCLFQEASFAGDLRDSNSTSGGLLCVFGSHTFIPISWMYKRQSAVSHSSAESEIVSLDAGLRTDGIPSSTILGVRVWKHCPVDQPRETLSVTNAREPIRLSLSLSCWVLCWW